MSLIRLELNTFNEMPLVGLSRVGLGEVRESQRGREREGEREGGTLIWPLKPSEGH